MPWKPLDTDPLVSLLAAIKDQLTDIAHTLNLIREALERDKR